MVKYLRNSEDARDIVQDVFEKLWNNRKKVDFDKAKSWMYTTAHNTLINFAVRKKRMVYSTEDLPEQGARDRHAFESRQVVDRIVNILPPIQKSIILLRDVEGYPYSDIGEILSLSESQVKVYLFRARMKIKKQLKELTELA